MRLRERTGEPDPQAERELEAIDRTLAGQSVDPDLAGWAELAEMLSEERPELDPDSDWASELDERVEQRFPRRPGEGPRGVAALWAWIDNAMPQRLSPAVAGFAVLAVVAVVATVTLSTGDDESGDSGSVRSLDGGLSSLDRESVEQMPTTTDDSAPAVPEAGGAAAPTDIPDVDNADLGEALNEAGGAQDPIAPGTDNRRVDRDVTMTLATPPDDVNATSDEAIAITRELDGIVATSNVSTGGNDALAVLELVIPSRNLDTAVDRLTDLGDVRSLVEASEDITRPFVTAQDELEDARAEREQLIEALGNAATDEEAEAIRLQIADVRKEISQLEAAFDKISRRAQLSDVSLTIKGDKDASAKGDEDGDTSLGDYVDDAEEVLKDIAGILLSSAAIMVPLGLIAALIWLATTRARRRRRERTLDES